MLVDTTELDDLCTMFKSNGLVDNTDGLFIPALETSYGTNAVNPGIHKHIIIHCLNAIIPGVKRMPKREISKSGKKKKKKRKTRPAKASEETAVHVSAHQSLIFR